MTENSRKLIMGGFFNDLRVGVRQLIKRPGFAAAAILTLALGIGANTAVFSFLSGYLFKPLPYPHSAQLAEVYTKRPKIGLRKTSPLSLPLYRVIQKHTDAFAATAFYRQSDFDLNIGGHARRAFGVVASASLFHVLGVEPFLGRAFTADNMRPGRDHVALISYGLWRASFGASPDAIGKTVKLNSNVYRIIGIMPQGFAFPDRTMALWMPYKTVPADFAANKALTALSSRFIGRLRPGVSLDAAEQQVQHAVGTWFRDRVSKTIIAKTGFAIGIQSLHQALLGDRPATLWLLQGAVALILLITCVNVANLLLSRILGRSHEIAMRSALGATRAVLARQLLTEALCLTVPGGLAGVALAWLALHFFLTGSPLGAGDSIFNIALDWRVGLFALGTVLVTVALVSVLPIRHLAKTDLQLVLQEGGHTSSGGRRTKRTRNALVIMELALATGLLAIAGLLLHSFMNLETVDPGFRKNDVLMANLLVSPKDHPGDQALSNLYTDIVKRASRLPGVKQAAIAHFLPLGGGIMRAEISIPGQEPPISGKPLFEMSNSISPGYFRTLGVPILRGRQFNARDA
jgi:putative ABC transport system permease protein